MTYSLIIPLYNEIIVLPELLKELQKLDKNIQIIIIDDGSYDGTSDLLNKHSDKFHIIKNNNNIGKGASIRKGINFASCKNIITMDGDLEINIGDLPIIIKRFENSNDDVLLGTRWEKNYKLPFEINRIGNFIINSIFNIFYQTNFADVLCCLKIIDTEAIKSFNLDSDRFSIEVEIMAKIVLNNLSYREEIVSYKRRNINQGKKLKMSDSYDIILKIFRTRFVS